MKGRLNQLIDYVYACIYEDYLMGILVTSASEGAIPSDGFDYGPGKSTFVWRFAHNLLKKWDEVFKSAHYFPWELEYFLMHQRKRAIIYIYEDMQETLGKDKSKDPYVRTLKNRLTIARPQLAIFIATASDIGQLAKPWRYFFNFEIKIPRRGVFEVQRIKKWTDFSNPYETKARFDRKTFSESLFLRLPDDIQKKYDKWRWERLRRVDLGEGEVRLRKVRNVLTHSAKELLTHLVRKSGLTRQTIIVDLEQREELRLLINCGLVEVFGDMVLPTIQARIVTKTLSEDEGIFQLT